MCNFYYLHLHHLDTCTRRIEFVVNYDFCASAVVDPATSQQKPCQALFYDHGRSGVLDYDNPCASGGCLASPDCSSGACRLEQLNGRWLCCRCGRGGNTQNWCRHPLKRSPDTFCEYSGRSVGSSG